jgi:GH25 family lysozyme M1 (1,4-beta-N-acetylmuramidase)
MRQIIPDVSHWSGAVDFNKMKSAGAAAVYAKASQFAVDDTFAANWKNAKGILPRGAYHYMDWHISELTQAKMFTDAMGGDWGELPPALDLEQSPALFGLQPNIVQSKVWNFLQAVEKTTGHVPMVYVGYYYWVEWMTPTNPTWAKYPLWLAWYAAESVIKVPPPWTKWSMWQYTGNGNGPQYGTHGLSLDMSYCDDLSSLLGVPVQPQPKICLCCGQPIPINPT